MKNNINAFLLCIFVFALIANCSSNRVEQKRQVDSKIRVILDTDANNELDDQHAIAYMLFNGDVFDVEGITVNRTFSGGDINQHFQEARRIVTLCGLDSQIDVYKGASGSFDEIKAHVNEFEFDGDDAVNFIIERASVASNRRLVLLPVGKLTNVALAIFKQPSIASKIRIVWLGSNYPEPGEYNQENDVAALNYLLETDVNFEIALVRYGKPSGTDAVRVSVTEIETRMPGKGPQIARSVTGRHGNSFTNFGDYSVSLFQHIDAHGIPPSRALYDMAVVAIVKNPDWASATTIPAPRLVNGKWTNQPDNRRSIIIWDKYASEQIIHDFYDRMDHYVLAKTGTM
ncbi:nucleoside hydrolase [candidate division KSB1 bacterium]|nr:nucleoside hydrolase [candidate division KSB1 bacterium]